MGEQIQRVPGTRQPAPFRHSPFKCPVRYTITDDSLSNHHGQVFLIISAKELFLRAQQLANDDSRRAAEVFFEIRRDFSETPEAFEAKKCLYELTGNADFEAWRDAEEQSLAEEMRVQKDAYASGKSGLIFVQNTYSISCLVASSLAAFLLAAYMLEAAGLPTIMPAGLAVLVTLAVIASSKRLRTKTRQLLPTLPDDILKGAGGLVSLGTIFLWAGNAIAVLMVATTIYILITDAYGPVGLGFVFVLFTYLVGFAFIGSAKTKCEKTTSN